MMRGERAYLDHNATTPMRPLAREALAEQLTRTGNASSIHAEGRAARAVLEEARRALGAFVGAPPRGVVFASGGTEALNLALTPTLDLGCGRFDVLLIAAGEHAAVRGGHRFAPETVESVALTPSGEIDLADLAGTLARCAGRRPMLALQGANNETGVIQPVAAAAELVHAAGGALICDGAQAAGKIACDMASLGADALVVSAHKFGGALGAGAVCFRTNDAHINETLVRGGGQERGFRAGTENVAAIAAMVAAAREAASARAGEAERLAAWRDGLESDISRLDAAASFFGREAPRLPNTTCFALPGVEAQLLLMYLDVEGVAVSSGSACSSGKVGRSHVLAAMRVAPDLAQGAIRVSLGWDSTRDDCALFVRALEKAVGAVRRRPDRAQGGAP